MCALLLSTVCRAGAAPVAAVLARPDAIERAAVAGAVAALLDAPTVTLADDVLLADPVLIIEKVRPRNRHGVPVTGRDFDRPEAFALSLKDGVCLLSRLSTGAERTLPTVHCVPLRPAH